jgi:hypothetical protein
MKGDTTLVFEGVAMLWSHELEHLFLQQTATPQHWSIACTGGDVSSGGCASVRLPLTHRRALRDGVRSARRHRRHHRDHKTSLLGPKAWSVDCDLLHDPTRAAAERQSHAFAYPTRASTSPAEGASGCTIRTALLPGLLSSQVSYRVTILCHVNH